LSGVVGARATPTTPTDHPAGQQPSSRRSHSRTPPSTGVVSDNLDMNPTGRWAPVGQMIKLDAPLHILCFLTRLFIKKRKKKRATVPS